MIVLAYNRFGNELTKVAMTKNDRRPSFDARPTLTAGFGGPGLSSRFGSVRTASA